MRAEGGTARRNSALTAVSLIIWEVHLKPVWLAQAQWSQSFSSKGGLVTG